jgi:hypothetical protein
MTASAAPRRLWVAWRSPSGSIPLVGHLLLVATERGPRYEFAYLKRAERLDGFRPLPGFPDLHRCYSSERLFPLFDNRLMSRGRPDYDEYLARLHLPTEAEPLEVLARSGRQMTDRVEVLPDVEDAEGRVTCLFFGRAVRHLPGAAEAIGHLHEGDQLALRDDPSNEWNPRALLLLRDGTRVAYLPDYLVEVVHELRQLNGEQPAVTVEHVNGPEVAPHLRLLCRLDAPWPKGWRPFGEADYEPLATLG